MQYLSRRRRSWWPLLVAMFVVPALVLTGCGDDDVASEGATSPGETPAAETTAEEDVDPTHVRIAYVQGFGSLPIHVAQEQGFFSDHGIEVSETPGADFPLWVQALDRQYDIVLSVGAVALGAKEAGLDVTVVSGLVRSHEKAPNNPIMTKDDEISSIEDLVGKRVGVLNIAGTVAESILMLVEEAGLDPNAVTLVPTPFPAMPDQLNAGQLDAASAAIPFDAVLEQQGYRSIGDPVVQASILTTDSDVSANAFFISSRSFADENPDVIEAWRSALEEAIDWIEANEEAARDLLVSWLGLPAEVAKIATLPDFAVDVAPEELKVFQEVGRSRGSLKGTADATELVWQP